MSVQTPFEKTEEWTSLQDERSFLDSLDGIGGLESRHIGSSVLGRSIWEYSIGSGESTTYILSMQHGPERATRESSMAILRDLCYRTETWMDSYLEGHRVVVIPTMNPDGYASGTRNNANGVNLNRDWIRIEQPETRAVYESIVRTNPDIIMDAHETSGQPGADWRPYPAGFPGEHPDLRSLATKFIEDTESIFSGYGWSTLWYPLGLLPWAGLSTVAGGTNRVGFLSETVSVDRTNKLRVDISHATYRELLLWHRDNLTQIVNARQEAITQASSASVRQTPYPTRQYVDDDSLSVSTTSAVGYRLLEPLPDKYTETFDIQYEGSTVYLDQPSRLIIAALLDPSSSQSVVAAERIYSSVDGSSLLSGVVKKDGLRYPIKGAVVKKDGLRYPVKGAVVKKDGLRYPSR